MTADIAIITAREDEYASIFDRLEPFQVGPLKSASGRRYAAFSVPTNGGNPCTVALGRCSEQGNDVSQLVAADMIRDLNPQLLLVVGIGGGVPHHDFTLGDVILSSRIHNFNVQALKQGAITFDVRGGIHPFASDLLANLPMYKRSLAAWNEPDKIGLPRPSVDLTWAQANVYGSRQWREEVREALTLHFGTPENSNRAPLFKTGSIASSNSLMKNTEIPTQWLEDARSILAVEMESAGVFQATQQMNKQYPMIAIRGISDILGFKRDEHWLAYACQTAGAFTCAFIQAGIIELRVSNQVVSTSPLSLMPATAPGLLGPQQKTTPPFDVFISYSRDDEPYKTALEKHLVMLKRSGLIRPWNSQQIGAGLERKEAVGKLINCAEIILLLISTSFLASDDLYEQELRYAMQRHASNQARVVPILIRQADISDTPFKDLQRLPRDGQPVVPGGDLDGKLASIALEIKRICEQLRDDALPHERGARIEDAGNK